MGYVNGIYIRVVSLVMYLMVGAGGGLMIFVRIHWSVVVVGVEVTPGAPV